MTTDANGPGHSRRTVLRSAAWATPVIAVAAASPLAAASEAPNSEANYYWNAEATGKYTTLEAEASGKKAQFTTQISYQADPYVNPPANGVLLVTVSFSQPVTVTLGSSQWTLVDGEDQPKETFTFRLTPSGQGGSLTFSIKAEESGTITATSSMLVENPTRPDGSEASWTSVTSSAVADLNE